MNIHHMITEIEKVDPEVYDRLNPRRKAIQQFAKLSGKLALTAAPLALGSLFNKAYSRGAKSAIVDVLQYALKLEYLEAEFYTNAVASGNIPAGAPASAFTTIRDHEIAHVALLRSIITASGAIPIPKPTFDFSAGNGSGNGPFKDVFTSYSLMLAVAQTLEDTGVHAYQGRTAELTSNNEVLTVVLQIHAVEARHAAHLRYMRRNFLSNTTIKPWVTGKDIININGISISASAASEAFDEPLTDTAVLAIIDPFIV